MKRHPLDPLTSAEIETAVFLTKAHPDLNTSICFCTVQLLETEKTAVLTYDGSQPFPRRAFLIVLDKTTSKTYEVVVNLSVSTVESVTHIPNVIPAVVDSWQVRWQKWRFRLGFNYRTLKIGQ